VGLVSALAIARGRPGRPRLRLAAGGLGTVVRPTVFALCDDECPFAPPELPFDTAMRRGAAPVDTAVTGSTTSCGAEAPA